MGEDADSSPEPSKPANWYLDRRLSDGTFVLKYWDGEKWTGERRYERLHPDPQIEHVNSGRRGTVTSALPQSGALVHWVDDPEAEWVSPVNQLRLTNPAERACGFEAFYFDSKGIMRRHGDPTTAWGWRRHRFNRAVEPVVSWGCSLIVWAVIALVVLGFAALSLKACVEDRGGGGSEGADGPQVEDFYR